MRSIAVSSTTILLMTDLENEKLDRRVGMIEEMIKISATDSNSEVRGKSKELFKSYVERWPERVEK